MGVAVIASRDWSLQLDTTAGQLGDGSGIGNVVQGLDDVAQCIAIVFTTPKGSDILRPTFGADLWKYIDRPINRTIPTIVREATAALTLWEPRIDLISVTAAPQLDGSAQTGAKLLVTVAYRLKLTGLVQTTTVAIGKLARAPLGEGI
jgi:phage baseplate assembly protein W